MKHPDLGDDDVELYYLNLSSHHLADLLENKELNHHKMKLQNTSAL